MTITSALFLDLALLAILVIAVIVAAKRGFLATVMKLCGTALALAISWLAATGLSDTVFNTFFKNNLIEKTTQMISEGGQVSIQTVVDKIAAFLPDSLVERIVGSGEQLQGILDSGTPGVASQVVDQVIAPLFLPIISVVVFFVCFAVTSVVIAFLVSALTNVNHIPIMGTLNRALGILAGVVLGLVYILLALCAIWAVILITGNELPYFNNETLSASLFYQFFQGIIPSYSTTF